MSALLAEAAPLAELMQRTDALLTGHFLLSAGQHSDRYIQCARLLQHPALAAAVGQRLAAEFAEQGIEVVLGPALGGILVAHEVARALGVRALFAERVNGALALRRGFALAPGERVLLVEDVVTTGLAARETAALVAQHGARVVGYGALVERTADHGLAPFAALWQVRPRLFEKESCPLCAAGVPLVKPGSRAAPGE